MGKTNLPLIEATKRNMGKTKLDEIGYWSEIKLDIIKKYAVAYTKIMNKQPHINSYHYIDGFAGPGIHISKNTNEFIPGSPANALKVISSTLMGTRRKCLKSWEKIIRK